MAATSSPAERTRSTAPRVAFRDVTERSGLPLGARPTWGAAFVDHDRDGWPDIFLNRHLRSPQLLRNRAGSFVRMNVPVLRRSAPGRAIYDRHNCAWGEANGDGRADLFCASGARGGEGRGPNQLLIDRGWGFRDRAGRHEVKDPLGRGRSGLWLDHDRDGDLDLFVANEMRSGSPNVLFRNNGRSYRRADRGLGRITSTRSAAWADWDADGRPDVMVLGHGDIGSRAYRNTGTGFREVSFPHVTGASWLSASWGDFDHDGWVDLALVSERRLLVLRNDEGNFVVRVDSGLGAGRMGAWLDVDNDADLDLFVVQGASGDPPATGAVNRPNFLLMKEGGGFTRRWGKTIRGPRRGNGDSAVTADFDRDGRVDVLVTNGYLDRPGRPQLLRNRSRGGNWIGIELRGTKKNPFGIGAKVRAHTPHRVLRATITDQVVFRGQSELGYVHFGLRRAERVSVRVVWPGGKVGCTRTRVNEVVKLAVGMRCD